MSPLDELLEVQQQAGGSLPEPPFATSNTCRFCRPQCLHFGHPRAEYQAAQDDCVVIDVSDRIQIELAGKDACAFLNNFCTNDIKRLGAGEGCEAFMTNAKGRILSHLFAFVAADAVWIDAPPTGEEGLLTHLDRYLFSEDVQLRGRTAEFGELFVTGPGSIAKLCALGVPADTLKDLQHTMHTQAGQKMAIRRVDMWGHRGFLLSVDRPHLAVIWKSIVAAGIRPAGAQTFHACRILSGFPLYGLDLSEDNLAQEASRTRQAISFNKGCYLGQEPIARIDALGHVNRQVCRVRLETSIVPTENLLIIDEGSREIGTLTSAMIVPGENGTVALAMLRTSHFQPGAVVLVKNGGEMIRASVF